MVSYKNLHRNPDCINLDVLEPFFSKQILSVGSVCRKMFYILAALSKQNNKPWMVSGDFIDKFSYEFRTSFYTKVDEDSFKPQFYIVHKPTLAEGAKNIERMAKEMFNGDKFCPEPYKYLKVTVMTKIGDFEYKKNLSTFSDRLHFDCTINKAKTTFSDKLAKFFMVDKDNSGIYYWKVNSVELQGED